MERFSENFENNLKNPSLNEVKKEWHRLIDEKISRKEFIDKETNWPDRINYHTLQLRKIISFFVIGLLSFEMIFLVMLIILQGFNIGSFKLDHWFFGIFANGCLLQTFFLIKSIVSHAFPADPQRTWIEFSKKTSATSPQT